jgi:hypothetical protein
MLLKVGAGLLAGFLGLTTAGSLVLFQGGVATVYVKKDDLRLWLPVPVAAAEIALRFLPESERRNLRRELEPVRPVTEAVLRELEGCPDVVFVEVRTPDEDVRVAKEGGDLVVNVESRRGDTVRVKVPFRSLSRVFATLAG